MLAPWVAFCALSFPAPDRDLEAALAKAGPNAVSLRRALSRCRPDRRGDLRFLIVNMPERDLRSYTGERLLENVHLAHEAFRAAPWRERVPQDVYRNAVLPYANVTEERDDWRRMLGDRYQKKALELGDPLKVALWMNENLFADFGVKYHPTKRRAPDQSPTETIRLKYASCTGLSILLVDALRSVGVPARLAGVYLWTDRSGNHTWVEVWDGSEWRYLGAAEPGPPDSTWFSEKAAKADGSRREFAVWAVRFERGADTFPVSWRRDPADIPAENVTERYQRVQAKRMGLDPEPTEFRLLEGTFVADDRTEVVWEGGREAGILAERLAEALGAKVGKSGTVRVREDRSLRGGCDVRVSVDSMEVAFDGPTGAAMAVEWIRRLRSRSESDRPVVRVPCCVIRREG
ncbi:MAG: transglutaminase-like domain-containing protein [Fimbriimonadales bacterium]